MELPHHTSGLVYTQFDQSSQHQWDQVLQLILTHLSEPYSIYVYWYFLNTFSRYCYIVSEDSNPDTIVGVIISRIISQRGVRNRGYIGMLVIDPKFRNRGIATTLVDITVCNMKQFDHVDEIMLETEVSNKGALALYESFGFVRTKRLCRYYLNTQDAFRLILPVLETSLKRVAFLPPCEVSQGA